MVKRYLQPRILELLALSRVVTVLGARQVGKTTLVNAIGDVLPDAKFRSLDDPALREAAREDPSAFVADRAATLIIDEVQRAPDLMLSIKERVDRENKSGQFLLTGSADLLDLETTPDTLPGRNVYTRLFGLSQAEIAGRPLPGETIVDEWFSGVFADRRASETGAEPLMPRVATGGYPDALDRPHEAVRLLLDSYVEASVRKQVDEIARVDSKGHMRRILSAVAARTTSVLNVTELGRDIGVNRLTAERYVRLLRDMFLVEAIPAWSRNIDKRQSKPPKVYVSDSAMMAALLGADPVSIDLLREGALAGALIECFVVTELLKVCSFSRLRTDAFHYRDSRGREVDLVLERANLDVIAVEIKKSSTVRADDFHAIDFLADRIGDQLKAGVVLYTGKETLRFGDRKAAVPIEALWAGAPV